MSQKAAITVGCLVDVQPPNRGESDGYQGLYTVVRAHSSDGSFDLVCGVHVIAKWDTGGPDGESYDVNLKPCRFAYAGKVCVKCDAQIEPDDVALAGDEPERCESCAD